MEPVRRDSFAPLFIGGKNRRTQSETAVIGNAYGVVFVTGAIIDKCGAGPS